MIETLLRGCGFRRIFYADNPAHLLDCGVDRRRERGIFFAFRDEAAMARRGADTRSWRDMDVAADRAAVLTPPPLPPAVKPRGWWRTRQRRR